MDAIQTQQRGADLDGHAPLWLAALTEWMEDDPHPRFIVSAYPECLWMNRAAAQLVDGDPARSGAPPSALGYFDRASLVALLAEATDAGVHWKAVPNSSGTRSVVWARALTGFDKPVFGLALPPADTAEEFTELIKTSRLTPAEARIIKVILNGETLASAATAAGVSRETIKTHLRNAYRKLNVGNRGELFARARRFLAP